MSISTEPQVRFRDLPADCFPFTITIFRLSDGEVTFEVAVAGPGAVHIPAAGPGELFGTFVEFANGEWYWHVPDTEVLL